MFDDARDQIYELSRELDSYERGAYGMEREMERLEAENMDLRAQVRDLERQVAFLMAGVSDDT